MEVFFLFYIYDNLEHLLTSDYKFSENIANINDEVTKNSDEIPTHHENLNKPLSNVIESTNTNENNSNDGKNIKEDKQSFKSKLTDRLAFFQTRKPNVVNLIEKEKPHEKEQHPAILNKQDNLQGKNPIQQSSFNKPILNKPNLLDRFNKNVNKEPIKIKFSQPGKEEKEILKVKDKEKEEIIQNKEEKPIENHEENETHNHENHDIPPAEEKLTPVDQEKLMKRMISAKGVNKGLTKGKDLGKSKASEKIMGLATMFKDRVGSKEISEENKVKNTYLLTNDTDIQLFGDDNKQITLNKLSEEPESQENNIKIDKKSMVDIMLEKPMYNTKVTKKRTPKVFKLKEDS